MNNQMNYKDIIVVDQTIREGMQYRGLMLSYDERIKILEFQELLGVDISQAGYPPAHGSEAESVMKLFSEAKRRKYAIRVSGLCRALTEDVKPMVEYGFTDFQLHLAFTHEMLKRRSVDSILRSLEDTIRYIRSKVKEPFIEVSVLDVGKTDADLLKTSAGFLIDGLDVDVLALPDTSGIMAPNLFFDSVKSITRMTKDKRTRIGVHCHNDMGMATANTIMGVAAGASVVQATALGVGERNGIGDIYLVGKCLKDQGYRLNIKTENIDLFKQYYQFINDLCKKKTGMDIMNYNTPVFGGSGKAHVAGTHGIAKYGRATDETYYLNVLCGKHLVKKYLDMNSIDYNAERIEEIVSKIKNKSVELSRAVSKDEVLDIVG